MLEEVRVKVADILDLQNMGGRDIDDEGRDTEKCNRVRERGRELARERERE